MNAARPLPVAGENGVPPYGELITTCREALHKRLQKCRYGQIEQTLWLMSLMDRLEWVISVQVPTPIKLPRGYPTHL